MQDELSVNFPYPELFPHLHHRRPKEKKISLLTSLQQTNQIQNWIQSITQTLENTKINQYSRYLDSGLELDDYKELINEQNELLNLYSF
jgi:DNA-binding SARP family transcriptional activator